MVKEKESLSELTLTAIEAALLAGDILRQGYGTRFAVDLKEGAQNFVTEYDRKAEHAIIQFIQSIYPDSNFLAEESGLSGASKGDLTWIIDPLDGTVNFVRHIPFFSVSIALEKAGQLLAGVVFQPMSQELFTSEKNKGSFLNGQRLQVSSTTSLEDSMLATGFPYNLKENPFHCIEHFVDILKHGIPIRRMGSAALDFAYTAAGRFDGFFEVSLSPWDCAAGQLILEEAGGKVSGWDGSPFDLRSKTPVLATNSHIHRETIQLLNKRRSL